MSVRHYVNPEPFDPAEVERLTPEQERFYTASQWLMWWKFRRHRLAVISAWFLLIMYGSILISEFIAPYNLHTTTPTSSARRSRSCSTTAASSSRSSTASTSSSTSRT